MQNFKIRFLKTQLLFKIVFFFKKHHIFLRFENVDFLHF
jgi:hypothetical protein